MLDRVLYPRLLDKKSANCYLATLKPGMQWQCNLATLVSGLQWKYQGFNSVIISFKNWKNKFLHTGRGIFRNSVTGGQIFRAQHEKNNSPWGYVPPPWMCFVHFTKSQRYSRKKEVSFPSSELIFLLFNKLNFSFFFIL